MLNDSSVAMLDKFGNAAFDFKDECQCHTLIVDQSHPNCLV